MSKVKVRCTNCGKWFQSANAKETLCPECAQKARKEKQAAKAAPVVEAKPSLQKAVPAPPKPKQTAMGGTNQWLDAVSDVKVAQPDQPVRPKIPSAPPRDTRAGAGNDVQTGTENTQGSENTHNERGPSSSGTSGVFSYRERREGNNRGPGNYRENDYRTPYRVGGGNGLASEPRPRQPMDGRSIPGGEFRPDRGNRPNYRDSKPGGRPKVKTPKPPPPPKPKREKIPPPLPFVPTPEQVEQVKTRYLELAQPEFDGIRTQIAQELGIPKKAVKQIVNEVRSSAFIPSWWDTQNFTGSDNDLERVREVYEPALPLPDIGVHKKIAQQLSLRPVDVYHAIRTIRLQMSLPQYNDPALHGIELKPRQPKGQHQDATKTLEAGQETATASIAHTTSSDIVVPTDDVSTTDTGSVTAISSTATEHTPAATPSTESVPQENAHDLLVPTDDTSTTDTATVVDAVNAETQAPVLAGQESYEPESNEQGKPENEAEQTIASEQHTSTGA
jgi:predicted  nucleic acid-binding Zn-ribbon protein